MTPEELQQYTTQYNSAMTPGGAAQGTSNFQNSPGYNMQFGQGMAQAYNNNQPLQNIIGGANWQNNPINSMQFGSQAGANWQNNPLNQMLQQPQLSNQQFMNSDAYKLAYGNNQAASPAERFQNDPGVQMAIQAGMPMLANSYSAKGLGASGPAANAVAQYMYNNYLDFNKGQSNLYNQEYGKQYQTQQNQVAGYQNQQALQNSTYQNQQALQAGLFQNQQQGVGNLFNNYQSQLQGLTNMGYGAAQQQAQNAYGSGQNLANLLSGYNQSTGQNIFQGGLGVNENIATLLANQGVLGANAYLGVGSAMSGNMLAGSQLGAQLANAQNQSNAQTMNSALAGQGALAGAGQLGRYF
jgi:hypothetical protein